MSPERHTIAVVVVDDATRDFIADNLLADGYAVERHDWPDLAICGRFPDAIVVDAGADGLSFIESVRVLDGASGDPTVPIVAMGAYDHRDSVRALERGADHFLGKPFTWPELLWHVRASVRQVARRRHRPTYVNGLEVDGRARVVRLNGQPLELSRKEYLLVKAMIAEPARVFTKAELLAIVWGARANASSRTLDTHMCRLRVKLCAVDGGRWCHNIWGVGYRLTYEGAPPAREAVVA